MADLLSIFPHFAWKIQNVSGFTKTTSPTFSFLGCNWTFKFIYTQSFKGNVCRIFLKRYEDKFGYTNLQLEAGFRLSTQQYSEWTFKEHMTLCDTSLLEWQIWEQEENLISIEKNSLKNLLENYHFVCTFFPNDGVLSNLPPAGYKKEVSTCFESCRYDIATLFNNHLMSDVILVCGHEKILAHRNILSVRSEVFAGMFRSNMKESEDRSVTINDVRPSIFKQLVRYIYTGETPDLTPDCVEDLYMAADMYKVSSLKMKCGIFMVENPQNENVDQASTSMDEVSFDRSILASHFINLKAVLSTDEWKRLREKEPQFADKALRFFVNESP